MASAYSTANGHWRARVVTDVTQEDATTITVRVRAYWCSIAYGFAVGGYGTASCGSYNSSRTRFTASSDTGETREQLVATKSQKYNKSSKSQAITCKSKIEITGGFENGTRTATVTHTIPAIDYSAPSAPSDCSASRSSDTQAKVTWDNGSTSTTKPRSSTKVERQTDSGSWSQIASVGSSTANYTDNGVGANHRYRYRVRAYGAGGYSGYATSDYIYTTPGKPSSVTATKTGAQSVQLAITGAAPYATSYAVERSTDGGSQWESAGTPTSFPWVDSEAPAGTVVYRVAAVRGSLQSAWVQSNSVTTITPPLAPAVSGLPSVAATGSALTVQWVPNHPDGSEQTSAEVEYTVGDGEPQTATVEGAATSYQLPESVTESAATVKVRVRTHGLDEDWGAWSGYTTVTVAVPPQAHFTNPAEDGAAVTVLPLVLTWEATDPTGIASQTLELAGADGGSLLSVQLAGDVRSFQIDDSVYALANLAEYELVLTVLGGSSLSTVAGRSFTTDWAEPSLPAAELDVDAGDLSCAVTVHAGEAVGAEAAVAEVPEGKTLGGAVVYGSTRQNLWVNPATRTLNGVTLTANADGSITLSGTATADTWIFITGYNLRQSTRYTLSVDKVIQNASEARAGVYIEEFDSADSTTVHVIANGQNSVSFTTKDDVKKANCAFFAYTGAVLTGTYRVMLNEGNTAEPWCPPGLNGVEELSIVTAGKNLLPKLHLNNSESVGITVTLNDDNSITLNGTATSRATFVLLGAAPFTDVLGEFVPGTYTLSVGSEAAGIIFEVMDWREKKSILAVNTIYSSSNTETLSNIAEYTYIRIQITDGTTLNNVTIYPQLELGPTATAYEPPAVTTTLVDLDGHALNSLPDGKRDELRIGPDGRAVITKRVGSAEIPGDASGMSWEASGSRAYFDLPSATSSKGTDQSSIIMCDVLPPRSGNEETYIIANNSDGNAYVKVAGAVSAADVANKVGGGTLLYPLADPVEVELTPVSLSLAGPGVMYAAANVPATVKPVYMVGSSFSVTRILPDGSQWLVADGLTDGQECIDPLPPLNVDFSYLVTAYAETGASSALTVHAFVDSGGMEAFNFGQAAETAFTLGFNATGSESISHSGETYRFALGPDTAQLPTFYPDGDIDVSGSHSYVTYDHELYRRIRSIVRDRSNSVCWFRSAMGYRARCVASFGFSYDASRYRLIDVSASLTEVVWKDPSNG